MSNINIQKLLFLLCIAVLFASESPVYAQAYRQSSGDSGVYGRTSASTNNFRQTNSTNTSNQRNSNLHLAGFGAVAPVFGAVGRNGLPPTRLDSFVRNAGGHAAHIYGDEGVTLPPYEEFSKVHRINTGIEGARDAGITTGHGSYLPDAWGGDEFVDGPEFTMSGANGGNPQHWSQGQYLGASPIAPSVTGQNSSRASNYNNQSGSPTFGFTIP